MLFGLPHTTASAKIREICENTDELALIILRQPEPELVLEPVPKPEAKGEPPVEEPEKAQASEVIEKMPEEKAQEKFLEQEKPETTEAKEPKVNNFVVRLRSWIFQNNRKQDSL